MENSIQMFERVNNVDLPSSTSYLPSNLSVLYLHGKTYVGVIHKGEFVIVCLSDENKIINRVIPKLSPQQMVLQGSWIWAENPLLVLLTTSVIQIFDWDGAILLHTHHANSPNNTTGASCLKGIAGLPSGRICIGVQTGEILLLTLKDSNNLAFIEEGRLKWFSSPVVALNDRQNTLVAASAKGEIVVATDEQDLQQKIEFNACNNADSCITCVELLSDAVIVGYVSGHIRIFDISNGHIKAEVCAHARSISCLGTAKASGMLVSVSEDTFVRIWRIDCTSQTLIEHKFSQCVKNCLLMGGRFTNENGTEFILSAYDKNFLIVYSM